jgi:hypothetical protein
MKEQVLLLSDIFLPCIFLSKNIRIAGIHQTIGTIALTTAPTPGTDRAPREAWSLVRRGAKNISKGKRR